MEHTVQYVSPIFTPPSRCVAFFFLDVIDTDRGASQDELRSQDARGKGARDRVRHVPRRNVPSGIHAPLPPRREGESRLRHHNNQPTVTYRPPTTQGFNRRHLGKQTAADLQN